MAGVAMCGTLAVPLESPIGWEVLSYARIPAHEVAFEATGLRIDVRRSAGPLVYPLTKPLTVSRVRSEGSVSTPLSLSEPSQQGRPGADDYVVRIGLVEAGARRLGRLQRLAAAAWVKRLFALAPPGTGISQVRFLNVAEAPEHIGNTRRHPLSDLLHEHVVTSVDSAGRFSIDHRFLEPIPVLALWLGSDGDDTGSTYTVTFERLQLN